MTATAERTTTITIARQALRTALNKLLAAVDTTSKALPVAQHILFDVAPGQLTLTATNFEAFVRLTVACECAGDGSVLLPAKLLGEIVANLPPATVTIALNTPHLGNARVTAGRSVFDIVGLGADEFPPLPDVENGRAVEVIAAPFMDALTRCAAHASDADSRPALNGVLVEREGDALVIVGCSGASLARLSGGVVAGPAFARQCSIHRQSVPILARLFAGLPDEEPITLSVDEHRLQVSSVDQVAQVRLVEHEFPSYRQLLKAERLFSAVCDRLLLAAALRRVALTSGETPTGHTGRVTITLADELLLRAEKGERGRATDAVPIESRAVSGTAARDTSITFGMNATLLIAALTTLTADRVELAIDGPERALVITPADQPESDPTLCLVMPLRLL